MQDEIRKSGITVIGDVAWGTHFCQFYQTKQDLIDTLVPYFKAGLENNEFCMWVTADNLTKEEARKAISKAMPGFSRYLKKGQIEILPYNEWYLKGGSFNSQNVLDGWVEKLNQALKQGFDGLRLTGNTFWLEKKDWCSFTDYEEAVNGVIGKYKMIALCTYCLDKCNATEIVDVISNHEFALIKQEGKWELFENSRYKTTKEALAEKERHLHQLYNSMNEGMAQHDVVHDAHGKVIDYIITSVNPAFEKNTGLTAGSVIGRKASELYGTSEPPYLDIYAEVVSTGNPAVFETFFSPMGKHFNISVFSPQKGMFVTVFTDITERKKVEERLTHLASFPGLNPNPIVELDTSCQIMYLNPAAKKRFPDISIQGIKHPFLLGCDTLLQKLKKGEFPSLNREINIGEFWYIQTIIYIPATYSYRFYGRDITGLKKAEKAQHQLLERLEIAYEAANAGAWDWNVVSGHIEWTPKMFELFGLDPSKSTASFEIWEDIIHPDDREKASEVINKSLQEHIFLDNEYRIVRPDGQIRWINALGKGVYDNQNNPVRMIGICIDITGRKKAEESIKESEERFRAISEASPIHISVSRISDGIILFINRSYSEAFGYKLKELIGHKATNLYADPMDRSSLIKKLNEQGFVNDYEVRVKRADGTPFWISVSLRIITYDGEPAILGASMNITERKQAEELLRETSNYLNNLFDYANAPIIVWDPQFRITRFNHAFESLTGIGADEAIGKQLDILFPEDSKAESLQHIRSTVSGKRWKVVEIPILHRDGTVRIVLWNSATLFGVDGKKMVATIAQGQDITERKRTEELLRETSSYLNNLFDYANAPIIVWDPQFRITRFNHAFESLTGMGADEAIGKQLDILFPEDSKAESLQHIRSTVSGKRWKVVEIPILHRDGTVRIVLWNSATLFGVDGKKMVATIAQGQDITERKQAEEAIKKLNEELRNRAAELEASNKELEAFAYSVSHDLRAPLRSMEGFSQALLEDFSNVINDEGKDYLRRIQGSAEWMAQLIDDMLGLAKLTRAGLQFQALNLSAMVNAVVSELRTTQPKRKVEVHITPGLTGYGDEKLIGIVLNNLLDNAWKFTEKIPEAHIEFGATEHEGKKAYFVRDNGVGFDMTYADKLFKPFQRLHSTSEFPGTGIGLASVQRVINRHGGKVWAEGKTGEGATFYFMLG